MTEQQAQIAMFEAYLAYEQVGHLAPAAYIERKQTYREYITTKDKWAATRSGDYSFPLEGYADWKATR